MFNTGISHSMNAQTAQIAIDYSGEFPMSKWAGEVGLGVRRPTK